MVKRSDKDRFKVTSVVQTPQLVNSNQLRLGLNSNRICNKSNSLTMILIGRRKIKNRVATVIENPGKSWNLWEKILGPGKPNIYFQKY